MSNKNIKNMHTINNDQLAEFSAYLNTFPSGKLSGESTMEVLRRLSEVWDRFAGSTEHRTTAKKLFRAEDLVWSPPCLFFTLERHGATVNGSSRASLHKWAVNMETGAAMVDDSAFRQLRPMAKRFDAKATAKVIAAVIIEGKEDPRVIRRADGTVRVLFSKAAPSGSQQTQSGRNRRLRDTLKVELNRLGWDPLTGNGSLCEFRKRTGSAS